MRALRTRGMSMSATSRSLRSAVGAPLVQQADAASHIEMVTHSCRELTRSISDPER